MARSGEPTEAPTARRLEQGRRQGEVAYSRDLSSAVGVAAAIVALTALGPGIAARLLGLLRNALTAAPAGGAPGPALLLGLEAMARVLAPPLGAAAAAALGASLLQTRGVLALGPLRPSLARLSPAVGLARVFEGRAALQMAKGLVKLALVGALAWVTVRPVLPGIVALAGTPPARLLGALAVLSARLAGRLALLGVAVGLADYLLVRRHHLRALRMTRDEVKRETKASEGDPGHRAERRRLHRALAEQRAVDEVRKADLVVVSSGSDILGTVGRAIALRYDRAGDGAPVIVATGERLVAERIKQVAREARVPIFRDETLARSLHDLPEGTEIPAALFEAVAELLRVVYESDRRV